MRQKLKFSKSLVHFKQWTNKRYAVFNSLHRVIKICTLALSYSLAVTPKQGNAQETDTISNKITSIEEVTVQASLLDLKSSELGRQVIIINSSQLQMAPVGSIDELLRYLPGIEAQSRGAFGTQADFSLRGANFNQMLVLIDGHKINDPLSGHLNSNIPISPAEIERIEVIYGSASSEYGPDAMGGIINIVTKTFTKEPNITKFNAEGKILYGQHNLISANPGFYYSNNKLSISAGSLLNISEGNPLSSGLKNDFNIQVYSASAAYKISNNTKVAYRYGYDFRNFNAQWYYSTSPFDSAHEKTSRNHHQLQISHNHGKQKTNLSASYISTDDKFVFNSKSTAMNSTSMGQTRLTHHIQFSDLISFLAGIEYDFRSIESNNRGNHNFSHGAIFTLLSFKFLEKLSINPSLRGDYDERSKFYLLPQLSINYTVNSNIRTRASVGKALRTPDFTELYYNNFAATVSPGNRLGNPKLNYETSWNYEGGVDAKIIRNLWLSTTFYYRKTKNQIDYISVNSSNIPDLNNLTPNATYWRAFNNSNVDTRGIDCRIIFRNRISSNITTDLSAGYSFTDVDIQSNNQPLYLLLHSKHLVNGSLSLTLYNLNININSSYRVRERSWYNANINRYLKKSYAVWNASADYPFLNKNLFASLAIFNLFDMNYSDFLGAEMPGRWIAGGIKFIF